MPHSKPLVEAYTAVPLFERATVPRLGVGVRTPCQVSGRSHSGPVGWGRVRRPLVRRCARGGQGRRSWVTWVVPCPFSRLGPGQPAILAAVADLYGMAGWLTPGLSPDPA